MTATTVRTVKRGRPRKVESYADWMARIDAQVDEAARRAEKLPPSFTSLHPAQRRLIQMFIDYLKRLPGLAPNESVFEKQEYRFVNYLITDIFIQKYPEWGKRGDFQNWPSRTRLHPQRRRAPVSMDAIQLHRSQASQNRAIRFRRRRGLGMLPDREGGVTTTDHRPNLLRCRD